MNIQQRIWVGLSLFALITISTGAQAKSKAKIKTCADLKTSSILKKARPFKSTIEKYARLHNVNADFVLAIAAVETCFNSRAVSPVGARGLMQLMPATAKRFGVRYRSNARQNVKGGTKYLRFLMRRYKSNMRYVAAAYNAGEGRVDRYKGVPPYRETRRYVRNVLTVYNKLSQYRKRQQSQDKKQQNTVRLNKKYKQEVDLIKPTPKYRRTSEKKEFLYAVNLLLG